MIPRRAAFVVAATLMLAACAGPKASPTPAPTPAPTPVVTAAPTPAPTQAASVPAVVCVGASTTYLDWLNSEFLPDTADPATPPADPSADLLAQIQAAGVIRVSTDKDYSPQSFLNPDGSWVGFDVDVAK